MLFLLLQAAQPDIEFNATVRARSVTIEKQGDARLSVYAEPEGAKSVDVQAPKANGRKTIDNVQVSVKAQTSVAAPVSPEATLEETDRPE